MKKLFTISDGRSVFVEEEGKIYELVDWKKEEWTYCDATGQPLPDYHPPEREDDLQPFTEDKTQVTETVNGFYVYTTHEYTMRPWGDKVGQFGVKAADGTKITEEIFTETDEGFQHGLLSVCNAENLWGCIDEKGNLVVPHKFSDRLRFNQYGVAVGNRTLVDRKGNEIPGTELGLDWYCDISYRYYATALLTEEQRNSIAVCGRAEDILLDIYDTKLRKYAAKGIPEDSKFDARFFEGEAEVIMAALELLPNYDEIELEEQGTIKAKKNGIVDIYDYYQQ